MRREVEGIMKENREGKGKGTGGRGLERKRSG